MGILLWPHVALSDKVIVTHEKLAHHLPYEHIHRSLATSLWLAF
jgi:hypothetical protein